MTNQQGAPEALRTVTRYEVVDCIDSKHVPAVIPNKDGPWVRYEDHLAALVEAQQPATHVQNPVEIEHVAGDVSKNGPKSNMTRAQVDAIVYACRQAGDDSTYAVVNAALQAQQPAPSAAAAVAVNTKTAELLSTTVGLLMGYREGGARQPYKQGSVIAKVIDEVVDHLKDWPYPEPSPTPQADSQPAPVRDDLPTGAIINGRALAERLENGYNFECEAGPLRMCSDWQEFVRCFDYLATWVENRAARAPADSVTAPAGGVVARLVVGYRVSDPHEPDLGHWLSEEPGAAWCVSEPLALATPPAWAADSVLEDAARWQAVGSMVEDVSGGDGHMVIVMTRNAKPEPFLQRFLADKIDVLRAARKQGGAT